MGWILQLLINAGVLLLIAYLHPGVKIKNYGTAIGVAFVIGLLNATIGFLLRLPLNILTLGLLSFFVRLLVTAIVIRITDKLFSGFETRSFGTALVVALVLAVVGTLLFYA
jgi:putative membrane protein